MRKINRRDVLKIVLILGFVAAIGASLGAIGRFTPTHAIVEPVYCGACHTDQVVELNATTHLPHFAGAIYEEAEAIAAGSSAEITQAEAISGGCMMCHNTWNNREKIYVNGYNLTSVNNQTSLGYNDIVFSATNKSTMYDVIVKLTGGSQFIRLGSDIVQTGANRPAITVQDVGGSSVVVGTKLVDPAEFTINATGVTLLGASANVTALNDSVPPGSVKIVYQLTSTQTRSLKDMWGDLSALSPTPGAFFNDQTGAYSCGNPEKAFCHAVEISVGKNVMNQLPENMLLGTKQAGSGNGIYFQHEMAYTSAEYAAKQVKFCGVCHFNKLPPMTADGEPIRQDLANAEVVIRVSHGAELINTTNLTKISADWAHKQVQCIRCHSHAGIGGEDAITGVRSP
jgi:hypothetical protein